MIIPNNNYNPYTNMYNQYPQSSMSTLPQSNNLNNTKIQVVRVNGKNGAEVYWMPPNSSILLLDQTAPIVWLKTTDGAGYPTLTPYDIIPHEAKIYTDPGTQELQERIKKLEDFINEQFNQSNTEQPSQSKRIITAK